MGESLSTADTLNFCRGLKTPQILELSGIGTKDVLEKLDVPVKVELPVGKNAQEHVFIGVTFGRYLVDSACMYLADADWKWLRRAEG